MQELIKNGIKEALKNLGINSENIVLEHPVDLKMGDYSTNVAMIYAKEMKMKPEDLAEKIIAQISRLNSDNGIKGVEEIEIASPGFINFYLSREFFTENVREILKQKENWGKNRLLVGKKVMVEYTQPNPFKPFHIGHLMSNAIGESISRIFEFSGAKIVRANYQGDIGPHVAKAIYQMLENKNDTNSARAENVSLSKQAEYIGQAYVKGNEAYENNPEAKKEIDEINQKIYNRSDEKINEIYDWGRKITLEAFEELYKLLGTKFDKYYFESEVAEIGKKIVMESREARPNDGIFEKSDGAIVFHGEKYDPKLHTRVFVNSQGLPTYETKELGLTMTKFKKENLFSKKLNLSIVTTAIEQAEYMKVVQKAISIMHPDLEKRMKHITHGMMRLLSGKMSSRKGNVVTGESLIYDSMNVVREKISERGFSDKEKEKIARIVGIAALKYSILKSSIGGDIVFDFEKSISFEGDSGPYLQYTAVRANSILNKAKDFLKGRPFNEIPEGITSLEKMLYQFPEIVGHAYQELAPHYIATYLTELASTFNTFYGNTKILDNENKCIAYHLGLVKSFYQTMKNGLWLLGIETPEKM